MSWGEQVFRYCERGQDPSFWAEPLNAVSNAGFLVIAGLAAVRARRLPEEASSTADRCAIWFLVVLAIAIGIGSFLFHTFATRWSRLADVVPIAIFMLGYLTFALRFFLDWGWGRIGMGVGVFIAASAVAATVSCPTQLTGITTFAREPCLKGTMGYAPALMALLLTGALIRQNHPAGRVLLNAAGLFLAAMILRWIDMRTCGWFSLLSHPFGTHVMWHLINALTVHLLLTAAIDAVAARASGATRA